MKPRRCGIQTLASDCVAEVRNSNGSAAEAWLVDKDRVRSQLDAKTQARLAFGGGTNDLYLAVVQQFRQVLRGQGLVFDK